MNRWILSLALSFACASIFGQEPPGCNTKTTKTAKHLMAVSTDRSTGKSKTPKRRVLDLRKNTKRPAKREASEYFPVIASPIFVPQESAGTAMTASNGFLYILSDGRLYKVSEKTLKTIQVATISRLINEPAANEKPNPGSRKSANEAKRPSKKATKSNKSD
jgi:hypothetical protein